MPDGPTVLLLLIGASLLALLGVDVFVTVFQPEGHGGPLTRHQSSLLWRFWRGIAPRGARRAEWLALGGPFLALVAPAVWALLLIAGFAFIYYPWIDRFLVSPGALRVPWTEALYYSGYAAATLGTGDVVPDLPSLRILTIVEAVSGFALLSASLSYILAIYRENGRKTTLASDLALHYETHEGDEEGAVAAQRDSWLEHVARELLHVTQAHSQYPILHYFRPVDPQGALALQLRPLVRLGTPRRVPGRSVGGETNYGAVLVAGAVERYLAAADERFVRSARHGGGGETVQDRYLRLLDYLGYPEGAAGLSSPPRH